ncbi:beta-lactamase family protein [Halobacillus yeomjeoni]|uniref:serine hydrolase domain-containing protein n=1 Tax=Halobacillus yeomjeoni TaxID=311194 RepID=UPI001CD1D886|nr:serine hydrolase domain-containing protein [Halobacillus yeomjeoni]MCA0983239.1 beta-lactamase family protein [Halobacillus yeomjeoni]
MNVNYENMVSWVEDIKERNKSSAAALTVMQNNRVVFEHYNGTHSNTYDATPVNKSSRFNVASVRKSYLGLTIAFALHEGKIGSLDDLACNYFKNIDPDIFGHTTIRHLVTHTHGLDETLSGEIIREFPAGEHWAYRGINIRLMTQLIREVYGISFPELLHKRVFLPMGLKRTKWETEEHDELVKVIIDPNQSGQDTFGTRGDGTQSNLFVSTRELALWGNLFLNKGRFKGEQIVPQPVIESAVSIQSPMHLSKEYPRNGMFWFVQDVPRDKSELGEKVPAGSYQILGVTGPTLLVIPKYNVVVAKMYNKRYNYGDGNYLYYLREFSNIVAETFKSSA